MAPLEAVLIWITIVGYALTSGMTINAFVFKKERWLGWIAPAVSVLFLTHTGAMIARYLAVGNLPWASDYETANAGAWFVVLFTLLALWKRRELRCIAVGTVPFALILLGFGVMRSPQLVPMAATLKSFWLGVHVLFAWLAFSSYAVAFGLGIVYLAKERQSPNPFYQRFPDLPVLDELMFKYLIFGFITDALMIASGAIWAKELWGNYWSWDPVETWSLITWLVYGLAIHLRVTMGWRGQRLAWILIFALTGNLMSFFGINLITRTTVHMFNVPLAR